MTTRHCLQIQWVHFDNSQCQSLWNKIWSGKILQSLCCKTKHLVLANPEDAVIGKGERSVGDLHGRDRGGVVPLEPAESMARKPVLQVPLLWYSLGFKQFFGLVGNRARWDLPSGPRFQNQDPLTWNLTGNLISKLVCFLQLFDLSAPSAVPRHF